MKRIHDLSQPVIAALAYPDKTVHDTAQFAAVNVKLDSIDEEFRDVLVRQGDVLLNNLMTKPYLDLAMITAQVTIAFVFGMLVRAQNAVLISEKGIKLDGKTSGIQSSGT
ncbi:MAG: hypothetical protein K2X93_18805 [Candidatus Obscuribacterales bacterium]|nr:hypothetical protein [Candidatus Obscuribacterales bacterium]